MKSEKLDLYTNIILKYKIRIIFCIKFVLEIYKIKKIKLNKLLTYNLNHIKYYLKK